jgi:isoquinoline 1-oxidoreductase
VIDLRVFELEPERYELKAAPRYRFELDRRGFLKTLGAGILIVSFLDRADAQRRRGPAAPQDVGSWLHISTAGKVTVFTGKVEVGQNSRTALTQAVAEELGAPHSSVEMVMGDTARVPYDMGTFGSMTTPRMAPVLRKAAAAARKLWPPGDWSTLRFDAAGEGVLHAAMIGEDVHPHQPRGESIPKVNGREFVTGGHKYASDMQVPGMLYGRMIRPDQYSAVIESFDAAPAEKLPGVKVVREGNFAGVVAGGTSAAAAAAKACRVEWKAPAAKSSSETIFRDLKAGAKVEPRQDIEVALAKSKSKIEQTYTVAYIAHVPLEPRASVAQWSSDGKLTVWTGTQVPFGVRDELAEAFGLQTADVHVMMPDTGSGYGGKHSGECAVEAARLAKSAGKPVKLVWTREEEFMWAYFRPAGVIDVRSGIDDAGRLTAWDFHNYNSGGSGIQTPYNVSVKRTEFHNAESPLRQGSYRGLAATANHFAREVQMDELAHLAKMDPLEFRLKNMSDPRLKAVLTAAAEKFQWGRATKPGCGIACGFEKGGYVACCAEVAPPVAAGKLPKITRLVVAFECGAIVNPKHLAMQVEGATVMGIGGAMFEAIEFAGGRLLNGRLSQYRVPRFRDVPPIEVVLVDRKDLPSAGAGETPIVGVAPAIANAVYAATGERLHGLPLFKAHGAQSRSEAGTN